MPRNDDATRRSTARERSQARMSRSSGSSSRSSTDSYGRARQDYADLSQSRYSRQAPRQSSQSSRVQESAARRSRQSSSQRSGAAGRSSRTSREPDRTRGANGRSRGSSDTRSSSATRSSRDRSRQTSQNGRRTGSRTDGQRTTRDGKRQASSSRPTGVASFIGNLPSWAVPAGIAVLAAIVVLALVFGVLVPSCSKSGGETQQQQQSSSSPESTQPGLVQSIGQAKQEAQTAVESANQVGALETSNTTVQALVSLLGEEDTAKLLSQAKTNPDALWIAAHPEKYAFDGIEVQYKILKLAADEPAAIPYVREFPAKYPMADAVTDKDLAMDVASPSSSVPNTSVPHLYQWDRRWAYTVYSSATFGLTGCGPTTLAMVYQGLNRTVDRTPHDMAVLAEERGFMSEFNGSDATMYLALAPELGMNCWEAYPDAASIRDELSQGHVIVANLGPGYFTVGGHFFVLAGLTDDGQVIVNDPYSVTRSSQTWDADFIAGESIAMFVFSKA